MLENVKHKHVSVGNVTFGNDLPFVLIAGPCQIESLEHALMMADKISQVAQKTRVPFVYKSSFDKANRSSISTARGVGMAAGLEILAAVKERFGCPVITDVHTAEQCASVSDVADILQIPAFLCRQTDLLLAAGKTGRAINVKKGQFLAPWDMKNVAEKVASTGNERILLCERGTSFGYNTLVTDFRSLPIMAETGYPVVFDATHSVQKPGGNGTSSGGERRFVPMLAKAAIAIGCSAIFIETHENPDHAPSDGPNMVPVNQLPQLLASMAQLQNAYDD